MRTREEINQDYIKLCAELGHFFVNAIFKNEAILDKFKQFKVLDKENNQLLANEESK